MRQKQQSFVSAGAEKEREGQSVPQHPRLVNPAMIRVEMGIVKVARGGWSPNTRSSPAFRIWLQAPLAPLEGAPGSARLPPLTSCQPPPPPSGIGHHTAQMWALGSRQGLAQVQLLTDLGQPILQPLGLPEGKGTS